MRNLKSLTDIIVFLEEVLGKPAATVFDESMEDFVYFVRSEALHNPDITETKMRNQLRKLAEGIIAASVKQFLNDNYADDHGDVELNVNDDGIFDKNMRPISAIEKIRESRREILSKMVATGMYEFSKGRHLAKVMDARISEHGNHKEPNPKDANWTPPTRLITLEPMEVQVMRLERKLPNITKDEGAQLTAMYAKLRECSLK